MPITELLQGERACILRIHMTNARTGAGRGELRAGRGAPVLRRRARPGRRAGRRQHAERKVRLARAREGLALRRGGHGGRACVHPPARAPAVGRLRSAAGGQLQNAFSAPITQAMRAEASGELDMRAVLLCPSLQCCSSPVRTPAACKAPTLLEESLTSVRQLPAEQVQQWQHTLWQLIGECLHNRMCPHCWVTRCRVPALRPRRSAASAATPPPRSRTAASSAAGVASAAQGLPPPGGGCSACQPAE